MNRRRSAEWSVMLFVVGLLAFNPPLLSIFSVPKLIFGVPILYLYIFVAWGVVIVLLALNVSQLTELEDSEPLRMPGPVPPPSDEEIDPSAIAGLGASAEQNRAED